MAGERIVDPALAAAALSEGASPLTAREHEVLDAARRHGTVAELAAALHLSPGTTRNHLSAIMQQARRLQPRGGHPRGGVEGLAPARRVAASAGRLTRPLRRSREA